jgi:hypothetical protein
MIDVVGINKEKRNLVFGVCLWDEERADVGEIKKLAKKASTIIPADEGWSVYYLGFAANGWEDGADKKAAKIVQNSANQKPWTVAGVRLLDLDKVNTDLSNWPGFIELTGI